MLFKSRVPIMILLCVCMASPFFAKAQTPEDSIPPPRFIERNLSGPRLGLTYVADKAELSDAMRNNDLGRWFSQFGWLFEYQIIPQGDAPSFIAQFSVLGTGVEHGVFYPDLSLLLGIRSSKGADIKIGPNIFLGGGKISHSALGISVGNNFDYSGVSIPVSIGVSVSPKGTRFSFLFGYATQKKSN